MLVSLLASGYWLSYKWFLNEINISRLFYWWYELVVIVRVWVSDSHFLFAQGRRCWHQDGDPSQWRKLDLEYVCFPSCLHV